MVAWTLALLAPGAARAQTAGPFPAADLDAARDLVAQMRAQTQAMAVRPAPAATEDAIPLDLLRCGPWGALCADSLSMIKSADRYNNDTGPIGTGFKALGTAGKTGAIDGPGVQGNGTYRVVNNEDYHLQMVVQTGYIAGEITVVRDPASGRTTMRFAGRRWDDSKGAWGPSEDATKDVVVEYDAKRDLGYIRWVEDSKWKSERYWNGSKGTGMTIEFGGGWDHDFQQDP